MPPLGPLKLNRRPGRLFDHFFPSEQQGFVDLHIAHSVRNKTSGRFNECFKIMILIFHFHK